MAYSVAELVGRLPRRPLRARFAAGPLVVEIYQEDPRLLPAMTPIEEDEDPVAAGGGLVPGLCLVWLAATDKTEPELLYRSQSWETPLKKGGTYYETALLELQLMLRALPDYHGDELLEDYTVAGLLFLTSRMGIALAAQVGVIELRPGAGRELLKPLPKTNPPGGSAPAAPKA